MDPLSDLILEIAKTLGVPPVTAALLIPLLITICNRAARLIPDNATGWLKYVRVVCVFIGLHVKDNSGVPAAIDSAGLLRRRAEPGTVPGGEFNPAEEQGALLLDESMKPNMFSRARDAMQDSNRAD